MTTAQSHSAKKGIFRAVVSSNRHVGQYFYRLKLDLSGSAAQAFSAAKPGQFVQLDLSATALPEPSSIPEHLADASRRQILLRRPFSFMDITTEKDRTFCELLYCVVGPATLRMTTLAAGDSLSIIGPLGNGFWIPAGRKIALLVAGGMGTAPLQHLAKVLTAEHCDIETIAFAGARTAKELPFESRLDEISQKLGFSLSEFAKYGVKSIVATDDGSAGFAGMVTDCLLQWLDKHSPAHDKIIIYGCGPEAMLARLTEIAKERNIDCQISMERRMACGFGVCQSCAVECRVPDSNETVYKLCCEDGPVFNSREIVFVQDCKTCQQKDDLLATIKPYRLVHKCFSEYISWICDNVIKYDLEKYDLISILNEKDFERLQRLESLLEKSRCILGVSETDFLRMFGFSNDLMVADPEKAHDILAEPLLVVDLDLHGFSSIQKIPRSLKSQGKLIPVADFIATLKNQKFAIELKTVRMESWLEEGKPIGNARIPSWWREMFRNNAITKIEDKDKRAIIQLKNTVIHYGCDCKMLVLYTRRLGPSTLMSATDLLDELKCLKNRYPEIDYFCSKNYFGQIVFYPELP